MAPPVNAARKIKERVSQELKVTASVGIASSKVAAKVASDYEKPYGLVEIPPGDDPHFLAPLPVEELPGVGEKTAQKLRTTLGIGTVGELARVSTSVLHRTFGAWGDLLHLWANGLDHSPITPTEPPKFIGRETTFPEDTADRSFLLGTLRYLAERVGAELRQEGKRARRVVVKLRYADFLTVTRHRTLELPICHDEAIFHAGATLFLKALQERKGRVRLVGISVADLVLHTEQLTLLERPEQRWERLSDTIDRIRYRHGFTSLQTGRTFLLRQRFPAERRGYVLKTACLSR